MRINRSSSAKEIAPIALAIHELAGGLPVAMRTKEKLGVRVENHQVIDWEYTGPTLEDVLKQGQIIRESTGSGVYKGVPVVVVPLIEDGETVAAIGVVDVTYGIYSEASLIGRRRPKP
jgi:hypothetical protein